MSVSTMQAGSDLAAGFGDPVHDAQDVFRAVLQAISRPGTVQGVVPAIEPPTPLGPAAAAVCLALLDLETPLWIDGAAETAGTAARFLAFHTGAPRVSEPAQAAFAVVADGRTLPPLDEFSQGTDEEPEKSATVIVQVEALTAGPPGAGCWRLTGPGIDGAAGLRVEGLRDGLGEELAGNRARFPRGIDLILCTDTQIAALPRTTRVEA